jgi:hypothetical protein
MDFQKEFQNDLLNKTRESDELLKVKIIFSTNYRLY